MVFFDLKEGDTVFIRRKISATEPEINKYRYKKSTLVVKNSKERRVGCEVLDGLDDNCCPSTHYESFLKDETVFVFTNPFNESPVLEAASEKNFILAVLGADSAKYRTVIEAECSDGQKYILDVSETKFKSDIMKKCQELRWNAERARDTRASLFKEFNLEYDDPYNKEHSRLED